ncbi:MAG: hypothetical protein ACYDBY_02985 [Thermoanaerobaculia bacterium]
MKSSLCKVFSLAALVLLVAVPAVADDAAVFRLDQGVQAGRLALPAGVYEFRVSNRGIVSVYDEEKATIVGVTLARREPLDLAHRSASATLTHDSAVRTLSIGDFRYCFRAGPAPTAIAARPQPTTVVALNR